MGVAAFTLLSEVALSSMVGGGDQGAVTVAVRAAILAEIRANEDRTADFNQGQSSATSSSSQQRGGGHNQEDQRGDHRSRQE